MKRNELWEIFASKLAFRVIHEKLDYQTTAMLEKWKSFTLKKLSNSVVLIAQKFVSKFGFWYGQFEYTYLTFELDSSNDTIFVFVNREDLFFSNQTLGIA